MRTFAAATIAVLLMCATPAAAGLYDGVTQLNVYDGHGRLIAPVLGFVGDGGAFPQYPVIALKLFAKTYAFRVGRMGLGGTSPVLFPRRECRGPAYLRVEDSVFPPSAVALGFLYTLADESAPTISLRVGCILDGHGGGTVEEYTENNVGRARQLFEINERYPLPFVVR